MGVYAATLCFIPAENHQVELAIAFIYQVTGISVRVKLGEVLPLLWTSLVRLHQLLHVLHRDVVAFKHLVQAADELCQGLRGDNGGRVGELVGHLGRVLVPTCSGGTAALLEWVLPTQEMLMSGFYLHLLLRYLLNGVVTSSSWWCVRVRVTVASLMEGLPEGRWEVS